MHEEYEDKFVAYVDILGFSELVRKSETGGDDAPTVRRILQLTKMLDRPNQREHFAEHGPVTCPCAPYREKNLNYRVKQISDCVVISAEISPAGLINLVQHCFGISIALLRAGHLYRGYVARGGVFHIDTQVFGPGYLRACEGEKRVSIFQTGDADRGTPFIAIDPDVCRYVREQPDTCVATMFGRMTETDGHSTAISPFQVLKRLPEAIFEKDSDVLRWRADVQVMREAMSRLLMLLGKAEDDASPSGRAKIQHYKHKIREVLAAKDRDEHMLDVLFRPDLGRNASDAFIPVSGVRGEPRALPPAGGLAPAPDPNERRAKREPVRGKAALF